MSVMLHQVTSRVSGIPGRPVRIYVPPEYDKYTGRRYPVLYMHDGQNVFKPGGEFGCWNAETAADAEIVAGRIPPLIIAAIDNTGFNRQTEYVPPGARYKDGPPGIADQYTRFVIEDVMPFVNHTVRTLRGPLNTSVAGSSLGGVVSLYLGFMTDAFGAIGSLSTAICWAQSFMRDIAARPRKNLRIYHDIGTAEPADMAPDNYREMPIELQRSLVGAGYGKSRDLAFVIAQGAHHNESAWAARFPSVLRWMFGSERTNSDWKPLGTSVPDNGIPEYTYTFS